MRCLKNFFSNFVALDLTIYHTIIYSLITEHTPNEVNFYMLDFADETLNAFSKAPHIGEVMLSNDSEKISRLFKSLYFQIRKRKKKLSILGMDYVTYVQKTADASEMPAFIIVIHNYTAFAELKVICWLSVVFTTKLNIKIKVNYRKCRNSACFPMIDLLFVCILSVVKASVYTETNSQSARFLM